MRVAESVMTVLTQPPLFLGFDPGGLQGFGVACLQGEKVEAATVSTVAAAMNWAEAACSIRAPMAAGIDTLLHWCDGPSGWRPADQKLRAIYPAMRASVMSPNGLFGSMSIGGMALAMRLRERWPDILLNETHPKVLMHALGSERYADKTAAAAVKWFADHSGLGLAEKTSGHELDAVLSAWATREGLQRCWTDLAESDASLLFPAGKVSYLWPEFGPAQPVRG